jgi:hypothetical protein
MATILVGRNPWPEGIVLSAQAVSQWGFLVEYGLVVGMLWFNQDR